MTRILQHLNFHRAGIVRYLPGGSDMAYDISCRPWGFGGVELRITLDL